MEGEYYKTKESVDEYIRLAKDVNGKQLISKLEQFLKPNATLLELGSGPGTDWKLLNQLYRVIGSDNSPEFLNHLKKDNQQGEFLDLDAVTLAIDQKLDGIYSNKVLHHLSDTELVESIQRQYETLQPNGIICHSFWKGEGNEFFKGLFVNYHTEESLKACLSDHFELLSIESYREFEDEDSLLVMGRKK